MTSSIADTSQGGEVAITHGDGGPILPTSRVETWLIVFCSLLMVVFPTIGVIGRTIGHDVPSASQYAQHATLWLGFLGALMATAGGRHLGLATSNFIKPGRTRDAVILYTSSVATIVCALFAVAAWQYVQATRSDEHLAGGFPVYWGELVVPATLTGISLRFACRATPSWVGRAVVLLASLAVLLALSHAPASAIVWPCTIVLVAAFVLGAPIFVVMAGLAMLFFHNDPSSTIASVPGATLEIVQNPTLPAIPLLTLAGFLLASGGASQRLVRAFKGLFGWLPGGVALMVISVCAMFTTFTGGSGVTILALGGILYPALVRDKYPEGFSLGLVTAAGSLGLLFPPSLPVILYGAIAGVDANRLFNAGLLPGLLLVLAVSGYAIHVAVKLKAPRQSFDLREAAAALWAAKLDLGLPVFVLFFFKSGLATIVEAGALGALYTIVVELVFHREIHVTKKMPDVFAQSATLVGAVVILFGVALGVTEYLVIAQAPDALSDWVHAHIHDRWAFLLALNGLLLVLGSVFEIYAAIIVLAPLIKPLGEAFGVDPVHLGVVFLANLEVGFLFPPMGVNLLLSASRFNKPLPYLYKHAAVFLLILVAGIIVVTYVPAISTGFASWLAHENASN